MIGREYKIAFIDEQQSDITRFKRYVRREDKDKRFSVISFIPHPDIELLIEDILMSGANAVISDYMLNEYKANITYNGIILVDRILNRKKSFPCFVLTSFDDEAAKQSSDVNLVYIKGLMSGEPTSKVSFLGRIEIQIDKYVETIENAEKELQRLEGIKQDRLLDGNEESRYIEMSILLDRENDNSIKMPRAFYSVETNKKLDDILSKTSQLISEINKQNDAAV